MVNDITEIVFAGSSMVVAIDCLLMLMAYKVVMKNRKGGDE